MGQRIRDFAWAATSLGPVDKWPQSLRSAISICLNSNFPIAVYWGPELVLLYNDAWSPIPGNKHPWALGRPARDVWPDIWTNIEPQFQKAFQGQPGGSRNALLPMQRHGYTEECYFDFTFTPVYGEGGKVEGVFNAVIETTKNILNERQLQTLTALGKALIDSGSHKEVIEETIQTLQQNPYDFPFAFFRSLENNKGVLSRSTPLGGAEALVPKEVDLAADNPTAAVLRNAVATRKLQLLEGVREKVGELPKGAWDVSPDKAIVVPVMQAGMKEPFGLLIIGLNPLRILDENYSNFFLLIADQMATSFAQVHVLEDERKRREALAEIDKAKTAFFTNISHEFRTPLTLMLGTVEEALRNADTTAALQQPLLVAHRNAMRLLKLVNTLLDFSRLEAGRVKAAYVQTDLAGFTESLASHFQSAIETAGLRFQVACQAINLPVYVDREMWEKIVLNLLSNAFKYTLRGSVTLSLAAENNEAVLTVADTGVGIPKSELPNMFQRFHRVQNVTGRTFEGTGIGLSLVKELVGLHGGDISVQSEEGVGSVFTVRIPTGKAHLPAAQVMEANDQRSFALADAFLQEAETLLATAANTAPAKPQTAEAADLPTVLVVDDNADMRHYITGLLQPAYNVVTAGNGQEALDLMATRKISLVLTDVMMPVMDGLQLLKTLKENPQTALIPVVLLSARAGDEAKVEGLNVGADDYLIKPFSAKELLTRIRSQLSLSKKRDDALQSVYRLFDEVPFAVAALKGPDLVIDYINQYNLNVWQQQKEDVIGKPLFTARPDIRASAESVHALVYQTGRRFEAKEGTVNLVRNGKPETLYFDFIIDPLRDEDGTIVGQLATSIDVTEKVRARQVIEASEKELSEMANAMPQLVWIADADGKVRFYNDRVAEFAGAKKLPDNQWQWEGLLHPEDLAPTNKAWMQAVATGETYVKEHRIQMKKGGYRWYLSRAHPQKDGTGNVLKWFGTATDIHEQKNLTEQLENLVAERTKELATANRDLYRSNEDLQQFAHVASHDLKEPVRKVRTFVSRLREEFDGQLPEKAKVYLEKIESAATRMYSMIDGVLLYSSVTAAEQKTEPVNLREIFQNIEADLEIVGAQKRARFVYEALPVVDGSPVLLYQLFYNLANNSLKFARAGVPPVVQVTAGEPSAEDLRKAGLTLEKRYVKITVRDNGIGFDNNDADRIFGSFARLHSKDRYEGTGLGLALCKKIAERHGGAIWASGAQGEGACFFILLPAIEEPAHYTINPGDGMPTR